MTRGWPLKDWKPLVLGGLLLFTFGVGLGGAAQEEGTLNVLIVDALPQTSSLETQTLRGIISNFLGKILEVRPFEQNPIDKAKITQGIPQAGEENPFDLKFDIILVFDSAGFTTALIKHDKAKVWAVTQFPIPDDVSSAMEFLSKKLNGIPGNVFEQGPCLGSCTIVTANQDGWPGLYASIFAREGFLRNGT